MYMIIVGMNDSHNSSNLTLAFHHNDYATNTAAMINKRYIAAKIQYFKNHSYNDDSDNSVNLIF